MQRVIVFIDGSNFYKGAKAKGIKMPWDLVEFANLLIGTGRRLIRVYYYNARSRPDEVPNQNFQAEEKFYNNLRNQDYCTVRLGRLEGKPGQMHQKGVDTLIVQDLLTLTFYNAIYVDLLKSCPNYFKSATK